MKYLFLANEGNTEDGGSSSSKSLRVKPFNALVEQNDYEVGDFTYSTFTQGQLTPPRANVNLDSLVPPRLDRAPAHLLPLRIRN